jgi:hypothetical protein
VTRNRHRSLALIAEEVAKVNPDLVVRDRDGEIYSVRYEAVNAMSLNEFLKEHRKVEELKKDLLNAMDRCRREDMRTAEVFASLDLLTRHTTPRWPFDEFKESKFCCWRPFVRGRAMAECACITECDTSGSWRCVAPGARLRIRRTVRPLF